jgi:hypothetical protein
VIDLRDERLPELLERYGPVLFTAGHGVELVFERGRKSVFDPLVKMLGEEAADDLADVGGMNRRLSMSTYSRSLSVEMMVAYVDGRPMPCSSRALTSEASE